MSTKAPQMNPAERKGGFGIDLRATAVTGIVLILADLTAFVVQVARAAATPHPMSGSVRWPV